MSFLKRNLTKGVDTLYQEDAHNPPPTLKIPVFIFYVSFHRWQRFYQINLVLRAKTLKEGVHRNLLYINRHRTTHRYINNLLRCSSMAKGMILRHSPRTRAFKRCSLYYWNTNIGWYSYNTFWLIDSIFKGRTGYLVINQPSHFKHGVKGRNSCLLLN